jgi:ABC-type glutathione transport system ATPase component
MLPAPPRAPAGAPPRAPPPLAPHRAAAAAAARATPTTAAAAPLAAAPGLAVDARGLELAYPSPGAGAPARPALRGADLAVARGTLHMLVGANGSGKSSLLRVLAGLAEPQAGRLALDAPAALVFQDPDHQVGGKKGRRGKKKAGAASVMYMTRVI